MKFVNHITTMFSIGDLEIPIKSMALGIIVAYE